MAEDRAEDDEVLLHGPVRRSLPRDPLIPPALDRLSGYVLKCEAAQDLVEPAHGQSVVGER